MSREKFCDSSDSWNRNLNILLNEGVEDGGDSQPLCGLPIAITDGLRSGPVLKQCGHFGDDLRVVRPTGEVGSPGDQTRVAAVKPLMENSKVDRCFGGNERLLRSDRAGHREEEQQHGPQTIHGNLRVDRPALNSVLKRQALHNGGIVRLIVLDFCDRKGVSQKGGPQKRILTFWD